MMFPLEFIDARSKSKFILREAFGFDFDVAFIFPRLALNTYSLAGACSLIGTFLFMQFLALLNLYHVVCL